MRSPWETAAQLAEALRSAVESAGIPHEDSKAAPVVTLSLGVAGAFPDKERDANWLIKAADDALYRSKEGGRNRVSVAYMDNLPA